MIRTDGAEMYGLFAGISFMEMQSAIAAHGDGASRQFVTFGVDGQSYAIDIMAVREIRHWNGSTAIPNVADYVRGVINLRGTIVPIIDLKARFGHGGIEPTARHAVVVVAINDKLHGLLVDSVSDIIAVSPSDIAPVPVMDGMEANRIFHGLITWQETLVIIVALERLISQQTNETQAA